MKVKIQHPHLPDGHKITLTGLNAELLNNQDVEVSDEAIVQYEAVTGKKFTETIKEKIFGGPGVKKEQPQAEGQQPGTTVVVNMQEKTPTQDEKE